MAKNTEKNAKPYNKKARVKKNRDYPRVSFVLNQEQKEQIKDIKSPGTVAKKLLLEYAEALKYVD